eukprot:m.93804 g.93804  ORF g.93804 m.93804 type:complete len:696 (-) comp8917_c8_seq6:155-2242(-)
MDAVKRTFGLRSHIIMLNKATSDKSDPTPGYMLSDITRLTFESTKMSTDLLEYFLSRLKKNSVFTKIKVLKILKHLISRAHEGFVRDLQERAADIRAAQEFKGSIDPLHGDTYNKQVREAASKLMDTLYSEAASATRDHPDSAKSSIANEGFGRDQSGSRNGNGSSMPTRTTPTPKATSIGSSYYTETTSDSGMKLWGMGSTRPKEESFLSKMKEKAKVAAGKVANVVNGDKSEPSKEGYLPQPTNSYSHMANSFQNHQRQGEKPVSAHELGSRGTYQSPSIHEVESTEQTSTITTDSEYIPRLVEAITAPGGVKVAPPDADLKAFVTKCHSLDGHKVVEALVDRIDDAEDKGVLKTLYVVRALAKSKIPGMKICLQELNPTLEDLSSDSNSSIRRKAQEVMRIMEGDAATKSNQRTHHPAQITHHQIQQPPTSLLDFGDDEPSTNDSNTNNNTNSLESLLMGDTIPAKTSNVNNSSENVGSLFSGMNIGGSQITTTTPPTSDLSDLGWLPTNPSTPQTQQQQQQPQQQQQQQASSLFSGMSLSSSSTATTSITNTTSSNVTTGGNLLDFGGDDTTSPQSTTSTSTTAISSGFSFISQPPAQQQPSQPSQSTSLDLGSLYSTSQPQQQQFPMMMGQPMQQMPMQQMPMQQMPMRQMPMMTTMQPQQQQQQQQKEEKKSANSMFSFVGDEIKKGRA